jgi:general secretion pathway protein D
VFGGGGGQGGDRGGSPSLMPGTNSTEIRDSGVDDTSGTSSAGIGGDAGMGGDSGTGGSSGTLSLDQHGSGNGSVTLQVQGDQVGVSAVDDTNSLLVRSTPQAWKSIREVIDRLDVMPMQVQIEAQVAEVQLTGDLQYGVSWYFENAVSDTAANGGAGLPNAAGRDIWGDIRGSIRPAATGTANQGLAWTFLGRNAAAVISALDQVTDVRLLQTPSVVVRNNVEAQLNVGTRIPISSVTVNPTTGSGDTTYSQVQYLDTGVILKVRPRITKDGLVFLDIAQEVSSPGAAPAGCTGNCNVPINTRKVKTEAITHSGDTVMLAGLISDSATKGSSGFPGLSRIPVIGGLFGTQKSSRGRNEVIVLITATVLRDQQEVRDLTDEYSRRFRAMEPIRQPPSNRK